MNHVLDACAMLAYLTGEAGAVVVDELLGDPAHDCYAHSLNLCEVYYDFVRRADAATADQAIADLKAAGLVERSDLDPEFWRAAGDLKATGRISLATAYAWRWPGGWMPTSSRRTIMSSMLSFPETSAPFDSSAEWPPRRMVDPLLRPQERQGLLRLLR